MILVDSNVLMYAAGADHPNKAAAVGFLEQVAAGEVVAAIDAEVLQEIIHRYRALNRWTEGRRLYSLARELFPEVLAVTGEVMDRAKEVIDADVSVSARDALHAAVVAVYGLEGICTFARDFDRIRGCRRVGI
ncbi:MAG: type II toxin-antitoxin system VapC family toxin [Acidobacteriota bacterium]